MPPTPPWPKCPVGAKGQHDISVLIPIDDQHPVVLFCNHCGTKDRVSIDLPVPLDDWAAADIARLTK